MTPLEGLYYALGEMAYAVAKSDGKVDKEEKERFQDIIENEVRFKDYNYEISEIIFKVLDKAKTTAESAYDSAIAMIRLNSHYLSPKLKDSFLKVMEKIAKAVPPVTNDEENILNRFRADIASIKGDPVYYGRAFS